jgi:hypothetical protein
VAPPFDDRGAPLIRPTSRRRGDDTGSAVAFLPILGLLVAGGIAALAGIALQPSDADATAAEVPNPTLGPACSTVVGPVPSGAQARLAWFDQLATCMRNRIEGATYGEDGTATGTAPVSGAEGLGDVSVQRTFDGEPRIVVRWTSTTIPPIVLQRLGQTPSSAHVVFDVPQGGPAASADATSSS